MIVNVGNLCGGHLDKYNEELVSKFEEKLEAQSHSFYACEEHGQSVNMETGLKFKKKF